MTEEERKEQFLEEIMNFVSTVHEGDYYLEGYADAYDVSKELRSLIKEYGLFK